MFLLTVSFLSSCSSRGPDFGTYSADSSTLDSGHSSDSSVGTDSDTNPIDTDTGGDTGTAGLVPLAESWCPGCNIILIVMDTQPWWTAELMGGMQGALTPNGAVLKNHFCGDAWTPACMTSVMAGTSTVDLGEQGELLGLSGDMAFIPLSDSHSRLAKTLQDAGYRTSLRSENFYLGTEANLAIGFDTVASPTQEIYSEAAAFANDIGNLMGEPGPWFATLMVMGSHTPYIDYGQDPATYQACDVDSLPPSVDLTSDRMDQAIMDNWSTYSDDQKTTISDVTTCTYDAQVGMVDDALWGPSPTSMWSTLNTMGALENTVVVVLSDHGEGFGTVMNSQTGIPGWGHKVNSKSEQTHVIAVVWGKDLAPQNITTPTDQGDIAPTVLASVGVDIPNDMPGAVVWDIPDRYLRTSVCDMSGWPWYAVLDSATGNRLHRLPDGNEAMCNIFSDPEETTEVSGADAALKSVLDTTVTSGKTGHWCGG